jgi:phage terminase small subunit
MSDLKDKQEMFCREYLVDLNAKQAAIRAGYSAHTAQEQGSRLLSYAKVSSRIADLIRERQGRVEITADYVLGSLKEVADRCMERAPVMVRDGREMVQKVDDEGRHVWEFDSAGANTALAHLGRHLRLFTDKLEHTGKDGAALFSLTDEQIKTEAREIALKLLAEEKSSESPGGSN